MKFNLKKAGAILISLILLCILLEGGGYLGILCLSKRYNYSPFYKLSGDFVSTENPYLRLRKILMGAPGYSPRCYPGYNLNYGLTPDYTLDGIKMHNEDGYRGEKINCIKGNKYRILFQGGYSVYGMLKDPGKSFPAQTGKILGDYLQKAGLSVDSVEIINGGIAEGTSAEDLNFYLHKFRYYKPDLVIINSGSTDAHIETSDDGFTPDYANSRNFELMQVERIVPALMFRSYFISFLAIAAYYHPGDVDIERGSTLIHVKNRPRWFSNDLKEKIKNGDYSYHPYYNNLRTLISEIRSDSAAVLLIPVAINPHWPYYHSDFKENVIGINKIIEHVAMEYKVPVMDFKYESVSPQYWHDYSNFLAEGEVQKAKLVVARVIPIIMESK